MVKEKAFMTYAQYSKKIKELNKKIKEANQASNFSYENMGRINVSAERKQQRLIKESEKLQKKAENWHKKHPKWRK